MNIFITLRNVSMPSLVSLMISPSIGLIVGYIYIFVVAIIFNKMGIYDGSDFFRVGLPIVFFGKPINDTTTYVVLLVVFFIHQMVNNWVNNVTYPWIINNIQDPTSKILVYPRRTSIVLINLFDIYSELDVIFVIGGLMTQFTFFLVIVIANVISGSCINWQYIKNKNVDFESSDFYNVL
jgi:hypothetical protein